MRTISLSQRSRQKLLHIEAPGCIVNIRIGLSDRDGRSVTAIEVLADGSRFAGETPWWIENKDGDASRNVRVVRADPKAEG